MRILQKKTKQFLGTIELPDGRVYISDPAYCPGTWCQGFLNNLKPGKYHGFINTAEVLGWGNRVTDIWIAHEDNVKSYPKKVMTGVDIGVDSGSAGIFDADYYEKYHPAYGVDSEWYDRQFDLRYDPADPDKEHPGITLDDRCVISFSGVGDGSYTLYAAKNAEGKVISVRIRFI